MVGESVAGSWRKFRAIVLPIQPYEFGGRCACRFAGLSLPPGAPGCLGALQICRFAPSVSGSAPSVSGSAPSMSGFAPSGKGLGPSATRSAPSVTPSASPKAPSRPSATGSMGSGAPAGPCRAGASSSGARGAPRPEGVKTTRGAPASQGAPRAQNGADGSATGAEAADGIGPAGHGQQREPAVDRDGRDGGAAAGETRGLQEGNDEGEE